MAKGDKSILELPIIEDPTGFWVVGSKVGTTLEDVESGRYSLSHYLQIIAEQLQMERRLTLNMETATMSLYIDEPTTIYKVAGKNVATVKVNGVGVALDVTVSVDIPAKSIVNFEVERILKDPTAYLYIYAKVKVL